MVPFHPSQVRVEGGLDVFGKRRESEGDASVGGRKRAATTPAASKCAVRTRYIGEVGHAPWHALGEQVVLGLVINRRVLRMGRMEKPRTKMEQQRRGDRVIDIDADGLRQVILGLQVGKRLWEAVVLWRDRVRRRIISREL